MFISILTKISHFRRLKLPEISFIYITLSFLLDASICENIQTAFAFKILSYSNANVNYLNTNLYNFQTINIFNLIIFIINMLCVLLNKIY